MLFEVRLSGVVMFWTEHEECVPSRAAIASMRKAGYQIYRDGRRAA